MKRSFFLAVGLMGVGGLSANASGYVVGGTFDGVTEWYASRSLSEITAQTPIVIAMHGYKDHAFNYTGRASANDPMLASLPADRVVVAFNQDTFGTAKAKERVRSVEGLAERYASFVREITAKYPNNPVLLYGHSLGGLIVATYVDRHDRELPKNVKAALLSAPALDLPPTVLDRWIKRPAVKALGAVVPWAPALPDFLPAKHMVNPHAETYQVQNGRAYRNNVLGDAHMDLTATLNPFRWARGAVIAPLAWLDGVGSAEDPQAAEELLRDDRIRNKLHDLGSARATIRGQEALLKSFNARSGGYSIPFAIGHAESDRITSAEASHKFIQKLRELENRSGAEHKSVFSVLADHARHALPTSTVGAPPALETLLARNPDLQRAFGTGEIHERESARVLRARQMFRWSRKVVPIVR